MNKLPPFSWISQSNAIPMPKQTNYPDWPFRAKYIFELMGVQEDEEIEDTTIPESEESINIKLTTLFSMGFTDAEANLEILKMHSYDIDRSVNYFLEQGAMAAQPTESEILNNNKLAILSYLGATDESLGPSINLNLDVHDAEAQESPESIENKMTVLTNMGFTDTHLNLEALKKNAYDVDRSVTMLLQSNQITESEILINNKLAVLSSLGFPNTELNLETLKANSCDLDRCINLLLDSGNMTSDNQDDDSSVDMTSSSGFDTCVICCNEHEIKATNWIVLPCNHKLCTQCYKQIEITRTTMDGLQQTFTKCPFCMKISGIEIGTCPNGTMNTWIVASSCEGYENYKTICIQYIINDPQYQMNRVAYLPDSDEGNEVLSLLKIAWVRRLCFTIGQSVTTGQVNTLVWNIHHKTSPNGGVQTHGFPDDTYLERVKSELKAFGIE